MYMKTKVLILKDFTIKEWENIVYSNKYSKELFNESQRGDSLP